MGSCAAELDGLFAGIRYSQRGTPPSTTGPPYSVESHMSDALRVLDHFGIDQAWAVGHSWGGHLALHLAVAHPERLLGVVCIAPLGAYDVFDEYGERLAAGRTPEQIERNEEIEERRRRGDVTEADLLERYAWIWEKFFLDPSKAIPVPDHAGVECSADTNESIRAHFQAGTLERGLPSVRVPVLFVHGVEDVLMLRCSTETAELIPGAVVELIPGSGHFPWIEQPERFRSAVERFLDERG